MPTPSPNEPGRMNESIKSRLPQGNGPNPPFAPPPDPPRPPVIYAQPYEDRPAPWTASRFLPAFWTIASLISLVVNVVLIVLLLIAFQMLGAIQATANDQASGLLGGLYQNFVKMEQATISRTIPVDASIPLNIEVPVQTTTTIFLAEDALIRSPRVYIKTGGLTLEAPAEILLPRDTPLSVDINFPLRVQTSIPVHIDVPVDIPLRETQLYEPFVGLQQVVEPWYCMVEPQALLPDGSQVCSPLGNPIP